MELMVDLMESIRFRRAVPVERTVEAMEEEEIDWGKLTDRREGVSSIRYPLASRRNQ